MVVAARQAPPAQSAAPLPAFTPDQFETRVRPLLAANCYACHQLSKQEVSYGTMGPSLHNFAKIRGYTSGNPSRVPNQRSVSAPTIAAANV